MSSPRDPAGTDPLAAARPGGGAPAAVAPPSSTAPGRGPVSERVAAALLAHPDVVRLSGGPFGTITTYLPGRRLTGVALGEGDEPTRVSVVVRLGARVPATAAAVRRIVAAETGATRVDVTVTDVAPPEQAAPDTAGAPVAP